MTTPERRAVAEIDAILRTLRPEQIRRLLADIQGAGCEPEPTHATTERLQ